MVTGFYHVLRYPVVVYRYSFSLRGNDMMLCRHTVWRFLVYENTNKTLFSLFDHALSYI